MKDKQRNRPVRYQDYIRITDDSGLVWRHFLRIFCFSIDLGIWFICGIAKLLFVIIADCQNNFTDQFDKVTLLEKPTCSYIDKLEMLNNPPFDENIY